MSEPSPEPTPEPAPAEPEPEPEVPSSHDLAGQFPADEVDATHNAE